MPSPSRRKLRSAPAACISAHLNAISQRALSQQSVQRAARCGLSSGLFSHTVACSTHCKEPLVSKDEVVVIDSVDVFKETHALYPRPVNHIKMAKL